MNPAFWRGKKVFVTGHTGFKGSWLSLWLSSAGAQVHGYSTAPPTEPNLFNVAHVEDALASHVIGDVRDGDAIKRVMAAAAPEVVFHLAAQSLVRYSYLEPAETYAVNVLGTVNVLEAIRACASVRSVVNVTTDKCYANREWLWGYREYEPLGGRDPYSSSKACSELVTVAYRDSFFAKANVAIATGRAGNVIGGGDWALDRLIPDFFRALDEARTLEVRFPDATRPWQHVLEPLSGYLMLAEQLALEGQRRAAGWNFGPADEDARPVRWILDHLCTQIPGAGWHNIAGEHVHEAGYLKLDSSKARGELRWRPRWTLAHALETTLDWHRAWRDGQDMRDVCLAQIRAHQGAGLD
ncbi:MAG: CDP-glucose 4,6-dehydratase [Pseudomonadota bacterium]|nr:CDP-glucose 4,6-dehydratase [Pseudomonadota bacterium]